MLSKLASSGRSMGLAVALFTLACAGSRPPSPPAPPAAAAAPGDAMLISIFLRHDQSKPLDEIQAQLKSTSFWAEFPPAGIEVVDWYVMMGIGQVIILRVPPSRLREVNLAVEKRAWGAFRSEFYPTYDYRAIAAEQRSKAGAAPLPDKPVQAEPSAPPPAQ
jgi:hypothetical protein